jgi:DNA-binding CsgD family transcriptional regulator
LTFEKDHAATLRPGPSLRNPRNLYTFAAQTTVVTVGAAMDAGMVARDAELSSIEAFIERLATGPAAFVLVGEPGIGKTTLLSAGRDRADRLGLQVLSCRCVESEVSLAFAGISDLLGPVVDEVAPSLAAPRRHALEVALLLAESDQTLVDERAVGLALLDALRILAADRPVVVAVDDLQWLDVSSAGVMRIALRRLQTECVGLLATLREGAGSELADVLAGERTTRLPLAPLTVAGVHHLLKEHLDFEPNRLEIGRLTEASGGNPFYALELGRELLRTGTLASSVPMLRVPESLHELLGARIARLPEDAGAMLLLAAAMARPTVETLSAAHGDPDRTTRALDLCVSEGLLSADESVLRFAHPLLSSVCYQQAPIWRRRNAHRALAAVVGEIEERARHLALAADGPDAAVARMLDLAAELAAARGATPSAAELCELAAGLTPADPAELRRRRLRAAHFNRLAGSGERAAEALEELLAEAPAGPERADILLELASTAHTDPIRVIALSDEALHEVPDDDARSARILAWRAWARAMSAVDASAALADGRAAVEKAERVGDPILLAIAIAQQGATETWAGEITPGLLERGAEIELRLPQMLEHHQSPRFALARRLWRLGRVDEARAILAQMLESVETRGADETRFAIAGELSTLEWFAGRWEQALKPAAELVYEVSVLSISPAFRVWAGRTKALIEADLGLVEQARATAGEALAIAESLRSDFLVRLAHGPLGRLAFAQGDLDTADDHLRGFSDELQAGTLNDPTNPVWADAIETLIARGEVDGARAHLDRQEQLANRLESPWAQASVSRGRGLLALAEGDLATATSAFEQALGRLDGMPFPFERARTLLGIGSAERKAKRKRAARETLEEALAIFEGLGAPLWAERARGELRRISGRRASERLTETEQRVATLAAEGRSNKEIAAALFVSEHTVAAHLTRIYRKLDVRSRAALAHRLAPGATDATKM